MQFATRENNTIRFVPLSAFLNPFSYTQIRQALWLCCPITCLERMHTQKSPKFGLFKYKRGQYVELLFILYIENMFFNGHLMKKVCQKTYWGMLWALKGQSPARSKY
jgi:hypothetical protein